MESGILIVSCATIGARGGHPLDFVEVPIFNSIDDQPRKLRTLDESLRLTEFVRNSSSRTESRIVGERRMSYERWSRRARRT